MEQASKEQDRRLTRQTILATLAIIALIAAFVAATEWLTRPLLGLAADAAHADAIPTIELIKLGVF